MLTNSFLSEKFGTPISSVVQKLFCGLFCLPTLSQTNAKNTSNIKSRREHGPSTSTLHCRGYRADSGRAELSAGAVLDAAFLGSLETAAAANRVVLQNVPSEGS